MYINLKQVITALKGPIKGVIHIGAHHGEEGADYANNGVQNVLWVEANKTLMKTLFDKTNNLPNKNEYINAVLSNVSDQELVLNVANNGQSSSILELGTHATQYPHIYYTGQVKMKSKTLDQLIKEKDIDRSKYDFINIDVQGAELKVLEGAGLFLASGQIKAIYTEVNFEEVYKGCCLVQDLDRFLSSFGFHRTITAAPEGTWGDALYSRT
jgi:FkbM family methyltransferase